MAPPKHRKSLYRWAFANQYNYILLGGAALFSLATFSWLPLVVGAGVEALWLALGTDTQFFREWVDSQESAEERARVAAAAAEALRTLQPNYVTRFRDLEAIADDIRRLAGDNPSLEASLIQAEMSKLGALLQSFLHMAVTHQRLVEYLQEENETDIQRDIQHSERLLATEKDLTVSTSLRQSLTLAQKRMRQHGKIESAFKVLTVKMDTLEKSFAYLRSHIVAIGRNEELTEEVNTLVLGIESVEALAEETAPLLTEVRQAKTALRTLERVR